MADQDALVRPARAESYGIMQAQEELKEKEDDVEDDTSNTLKLLFFICGLSTFARSESVLMQTQMYADCFGLGPNFYAAASSAIFMPGIIVQLVQTRFDRAVDRRFGTYTAAAVRITLAFICELTFHRHLTYFAKLCSVAIPCLI